MLGEGVTLTTMFERRVVPPWGALGGDDGLPFQVTLNPGPGARIVGGKETLMLRRGDLVLVETCGGGGYGPPTGRRRELREHDQQGRVPYERSPGSGGDRHDGAAKGMGRAICLTLAQAGAHVALAAREAGPLEALAHEIAGQEGRRWCSPPT